MAPLFVKTMLNIAYYSRLRTSVFKIAPGPTTVGLIIDTGY